MIVQADEFSGTNSVTVCVFTTNPVEAPLFRLVVEPDEENGLREVSALMVDKLTTIPRDKLGRNIGRLATRDILRTDVAILVFLGLARPSRTR